MLLHDMTKKDKWSFEENKNHVVHTFLAMNYENLTLNIHKHVPASPYNNP